MYEIRKYSFSQMPEYFMLKYPLHILVVFNSIKIIHTGIRCIVTLIKLNIDVLLQLFLVLHTPVS